MTLMIIALFAAVADGPAPIYTADDLRRACEDTTDAKRSGQCAGYVQAIAKALDVSNSIATGDDCVPAIVTQEQLVQIVVDDIEESPENSRLSAYGVSTFAIANAFRCEVRHPNPEPGVLENLLPQPRG